MIGVNDLPRKMRMNIIRAFVRDRRITIAAPSELPDGTNVIVKVGPVDEKIGCDESEWRDDPEAIEDWSNWLKTILPVPFRTEGAFEEEFRRFNIEAVRTV
jgi:hypothetical protein